MSHNATASGLASADMEYRETGIHLDIAIVEVDEFRWPESAVELRLQRSLQLSYSVEALPIVQ